MSRLIGLSACAWVMLGVTCSWAWADELGDLRAENQRLRQQVSDLSAELLKLRDEVTRLQALLPPLPPPAPAPAEAAVAEANAAKESPAQEGEAGPADTERKDTIRNLGFMLQRIPRDLLPRPKEGWDQFSWPKVQEWMQREWLGHPIDIGVTLAAAPRLDRIADAVDENQRWRVTYAFACPSHPYMELIFCSRLKVVSVAEGFSTLWPPQPAVARIMNEPRAKEEARRREGAAAKVRGTIRGVQFSGVGNGTYDLTIEVEGVSVLFR